MSGRPCKHPVEYIKEVSEEIDCRSHLVFKCTRCGHLIKRSKVPSDWWEEWKQKTNENMPEEEIPF